MFVIQCSHLLVHETLNCKTTLENKNKNKIRFDQINIPCFQTTRATVKKKLSK